MIDTLLKNKFYVVSFMFFIAFIVSVVIYGRFIQNKESKIVVENYRANSKKIKSYISDLIRLKEKSTLAIAFTLASNKDLKRYILDENIPKSYYDKLIEDFKKNTLYKNIWIQILNRHGKSIYRSWTDINDDDTTKIREDLQNTIKKRKISYSVSIDEFDLNIKSIVPVMDDDEFVGALEIISHFNSISKILKENGVDSIVVANKVYAKRLKYPFTKKFVDGYYIANFDAPNNLIKLLEKYDVKSFITDDYKIFLDYFIVNYPLKNIDNKVIGHYFAFQKLTSIKSKELEYFKFKSFVFALLVLMALAGVVNITLYYNMRKQKIYYKNILDSSNNIILVNDKKSIIDANKVFFKYFSKYKTLEEFKKDNKCICNFFVKEDGYLSRGKEKYSWLDTILSNKDKVHKVKIIIDKNIYYFSVFASLISKSEQHYSVTFSDITQEEMYKKELETISVKDPLTNLYNRRYYKDKIEHEMYNAKRYGYDLSIMMMDIDYFKSINDKHGHNVGDEVLIYYTKIIAKSLRDSDTVCRMGGEEFLVMLPHTSLDDALKIAEKLRASVENSKKIIPITMSFGVTQYINGESEEYLYKRVDKALYKAKTNGRNRVEVE